MSATEQIRAILDDLMGTARDGSEAKRHQSQSKQPYRDRDRDRDRDRGDFDRGDRNRDRDRTDRIRDRDRNRERDRVRERNNGNNRDRERYRERSRSDGRAYDGQPRNFRDHHRGFEARTSREREPPGRPFRDRPEGRLQEREILYQRRLNELEKREAEKLRRLAIKSEEENSRKLLEEQESRKLKEFLEDYNDDRDDVRFYRGSALARRLADRRREIKMDEASSLKEQMELKSLSKEYKLSVSSATNNNNDIEEDAADSTNNNNFETTSNANTVDHNTDNVDTTSNNNDNNTNEIPPENRKEQVEKLIERIPTSKEDLFSWKLDWSALDDNLMEKRIKPWIAKKIAFFFDDMGEKENDLILWICTSLNAHADGNSILKQVALVLEDDAEKFIVQMWRLLVFELEAKALGLRK